VDRQSQPPFYSVAQTGFTGNLLSRRNHAREWEVPKEPVAAKKKLRSGMMREEEKLRRKGIWVLPKTLGKSV